MGRLVVMVACLFVKLISIASTSAATNPTFYEHDPAEIKELLRRLNKPALKSIQSPDGDIIDCVLIHHQPAFDHPLLKDHVIQMRPSSEPEGEIEESNNNSAYSGMNETCPEGTVPIRRTTEEDLLRAKSLQHFGKKVPTTNSSSSTLNPKLTGFGQGHEYGIVDVGSGYYRGARATINVWRPEVEQADEFSLSQLWILSGRFDDDTLNSVEVGWQVFPKLYGNSNPHLFTYWTRDAYQSSGCYNLLCPGFVQLSRYIHVGANISPVSYGGHLYEIVLQVWKNEADKKWWLKYGNEVVGYWPTALFTGLGDGGNDVQFGGEVVINGENGHTSTKMGSGHFANEGYGKASYIKDYQTVDANNNYQTPVSPNYFASNPNCYSVAAAKNPGNRDHIFYYGGPGRNPSCP